MCTACALPKGVTLTEKEFDNCWDSNQDGGGFVYINEDGKLVTYKALKLDDFKKLWKEHHGRHGAYSPFLLHFRAASAGKIDEDNCHPFLPNPKVAFIHNGTIRKVGTDDGRSDTRIFCEDYLAKLPHNFLNNAPIMAMMADYVGDNKIAFMNNLGETWFTNKSQWKEHNGGLFSNDWFKIARTRSYGTDATGMGDWSGYGYQPPIAQVAGAAATMAVATIKSRIQNQGPISYKYCIGCCLSVNSSSQFWNINRTVCMDCSTEIDTIAKALSITEWKAKDLFLEAAKTHTKENFYRKYSLPLEETEEPKPVQIVTLQDVIDETEIENEVNRILSKHIADISKKEFEFIYQNGVDLDGI